MKAQENQKYSIFFSRNPEKLKEDIQYFVQKFQIEHAFIDYECKKAIDYGSLS